MAKPIIIEEDETKKVNSQKRKLSNKSTTAIMESFKKMTRPNPEKGIVTSISFKRRKTYQNTLELFFDEDNTVIDWKLHSDCHKMTQGILNKILFEIEQGVDPVNSIMFQIHKSETRIRKAKLWKNK